MTQGKATGAACLSETERRVLKAIPFEADWSRVRLYGPVCAGSAGWLRRLVLQASRNRAVALGNHVFLPDRCHGDLAVLAHELTHCGQYQAWGSWAYYARGATAQVKELLFRTLKIGTSPYQYSVEAGRPFEAYGMEQQAQIVEDSFRTDQG